MTSQSRASLRIAAMSGDVSQNLNLELNVWWPTGPVHMSSSVFLFFLRIPNPGTFAIGAMAEAGDPLGGAGTEAGSCRLRSQDLGGRVRLATVGVSIFCASVRGSSHDKENKNHDKNPNNNGCICKVHHVQAQLSRFQGPAVKASTASCKWWQHQVSKNQP